MSDQNINPTDLLAEACAYNDFSDIKKAIKLGANIHLDGCQTFEPLIQFGNIQAVEYLIKHHANIHDYMSTIYPCIEYGDLDILKLLVKHGAQVNNPKDTFLHCAVLFKRLDIVRYLVEQGCSPNAHNNAPITEAASLPFTDIIQYFIIDCGQDISLVTNNEFTSSAVKEWAKEYKKVQDFHEKLQHDLPDLVQSSKKLKV